MFIPGFDYDSYDATSSAGWSVWFLDTNPVPPKAQGRTRKEKIPGPTGVGLRIPAIVEEYIRTVFIFLRFGVPIETENSKPAS